MCTINREPIWRVHCTRVTILASIVGSSIGDMMTLHKNAMMLHLAWFVMNLEFDKA